ncbi:sensor histidine kinase [Cohnella pontilimi]|uniref:histidine kinase n=2 Tax=Cohnella pontilimi TaxID=2564100 RepID=A0A4U0F920_9BACL|nr:sensor histidine kinase [Cohnella pontilimi]TJY41185.1 sensor histidine kinase [Cohnella pontilimi]
MFSYVVFITIPVLVVGYFSYSIFNESIRNQTQVNIQGTLKQMEDNIAYQQEDIERVVDVLYRDGTLAKHLRSYQPGWEKYYALTEYSLPKFRTALETTTQNIWLSVYVHNELMPEIYHDYGAADPLLREAQLLDIYNIRRIADKDWYLHFPKEEYGTTKQWQQIEDDERFRRVSFIRRLVDVPFPPQIQEVGFMRVSVHLSELFQSVDHHEIGKNSALVVADDRGRAIYSSGDPSALQGIDWNQYTASDRLIIRQPLPGLPFQLIASVSADILEKDAQKVTTLTAVVCLICFLVFSVVAVFISRYFTKRVMKIVAVLKAFREGDFHKRLYLKGNDEFYHIAQALNEMGQNTHQLIEEVYVTNLKKKEAELESLQAQVNPHFLYNTLSSISRLAKFGEVEKQHQMIMNLATFYRLSLNDGRMIIPVGKELEQAQAYLDIQKVKYEERLSVQFDIQPEVIRYDTMKLILQPFLENVLKHAWCADRIHVRITGELSGDTIVYRIIDDGVGMTAQRIHEILDPEETGKSGYGVRNVDQRIKLHYGKDYGVNVYSRPGIGTTVRITIPAVYRTPA